jgi:hypothetical protein
MGKSSVAAINADVYTLSFVAFLRMSLLLITVNTDVRKEDALLPSSSSNFVFILSPCKKFVKVLCVVANSVFIVVFD